MVNAMRRNPYITGGDEVEPRESCMADENIQAAIRYSQQLEKEWRTPLSKLQVMEKALDYLIEVYLVADEYEDEERTEQASKIKDNLLKRMGE